MHGRQEAAQFFRHAHAILEQLVGNDAVVPVAGLHPCAAPAKRVGQPDQARVAVVERVGERGAVGVGGEADRIGSAVAPAIAGARIAFDAQLVAVGARIAEIEERAPPVVAVVIEVEAARIEVRLALEHVVAHHAAHIGEGAGFGETAERTVDHAAGGVGVAEAQRQFDPALGLVVVETGIEAVDGDHEIGRRLILQRAVDPEALEPGRGDEALVAADDVRIAGRAIAGIAPGVEFLQLVGLVGIGRRQRDADRVVGKLVDEGRVQAIAVIARARVERAYIRVGTLRPDREDRLVHFQRADRAHVDGADQALADEAGRGGLVDIDLADDFGGVLVEFDRAAIAGGGLFAPVQQRLGEVRAEAANGDHVGAAVEPLRGDAGQAGDRFPDRIVGQLADILGSDRFQDQVAVALLVDRAFQSGAKAADHDDVLVSIVVGDRLTVFFRIGDGRLGGLRCGDARHGSTGQNQGDGTGAQAGAAAKRIAVGHDSSLSPVCGAAIPSVARCTWPGLDRPVLGASAAVIMQHRARAGRSHTYTRSCVAIGAVGCGRNVDAPLAHRAGHHHRRNHAIFAAARCAARVRQLPCSAT